jgi:hypothetical protein
MTGLHLTPTDVQLYDRFLSVFFPVEASDVALSDEEKTHGAILTPPPLPSPRFLLSIRRWSRASESIYQCSSHF